MNVPQPFILASSSTVRKRVLEAHGISFSAIDSGLDEKAYSEHRAIQRAQLLAREKALSVAKRYPEGWVCGCDTVVTTEKGEALEKPRDAIDAERMMRLQSGQCTIIYTGMCLIAPHTSSKVIEQMAIARMNFRSLVEADIQWWLSTQDWAGAAGAFRSTGKERLLASYEGDPALLDGISVACLTELIAKL